MKIQINSLEALERLIGGDTELEMEVRSSVAENFSKKWLSTLAREFVTSQLETRYRKELAELFSKEYDYSEKEFRPTLTSEGRAIGKDFIKNTFRSLVDEKVREILNEDKDFLEQIVKDYVAYCVENQLKKLTRELVEEEAKKQIKAKFG